MFKKETYVWDTASFNKLEEIFDAIVDRFREMDKKIEGLKDALDKYKAQLDKLEKEPKVVNNYFPQSTYPVGPSPYPQPVWCSTSAESKSGT